MLRSNSPLTEEPALWAFVNGTASQRPSSWRGWKTRPYRARLSGTTLPPSMADAGVEQWISSWRGSHALQSVKQENDSEPQTNDGSGQKLLTSSKTSSPPPCSSKTCPVYSQPVEASLLNRRGTPDAIATLVGNQWLSPQLELGERWVTYSENWPVSGSMRSGVVYRRPRSVPPILEPESSSSPGDKKWPTPTAQDSESSGRSTTSTGVMHPGTTLTDAARDFWATPRTKTGGPESSARKKELGRKRSGGSDLQAQALEFGMWPTPAASLVNMQENPQTWLARAEKLREKGINGNGAGMPLGIAAQLWATPTAHDGRRPGVDIHSTQDRNLSKEAKLWHTPSANDWKGSSKPGQRRGQLSEDGLLWGMDSRCSPPDEPTQSNGNESSPPIQTSRLLLNPKFTAWLMGLPATWTCVCAHGQSNSASLAMLLYLSRLQQHLDFLFGGP
jgi:hypothetical protein